MPAARTIASVAAVALAMTLAPAAMPDVTQPGSAERCAAWRVEYTLRANVQLTDTPLGAGNGTYPVGPGAMVLQFDNVDGKPAGNVRMLSYKMRDHFVVRARALFVKTTVTTRAKSRVTPDSRGIAAEGKLNGQSVNWTSKVRGFRADGTVTCEGMCGKFGAPPAGTSELRIPPHDVEFKPLAYKKDLQTFKMPYSFVAKTSMPKQTAHIALSGREVRRQPAECK
jgi:hypothetical protein